MWHFRPRGMTRSRPRLPFVCRVFALPPPPDRRGLYESNAALTCSAGAGAGAAVPFCPIWAACKAAGVFLVYLHTAVRIANSWKSKILSNHGRNSGAAGPADGEGAGRPGGEEGQSREAGMGRRHLQALPMRCVVVVVMVVVCSFLLFVVHPSEAPQGSFKWVGGRGFLPPLLSIPLVRKNNYIHLTRCSGILQSSVMPPFYYNSNTPKMIRLFSKSFDPKTWVLPPSWTAVFPSYVRTRSLAT